MRYLYFFPGFILSLFPRSLQMFVGKLLGRLAYKLIKKRAQITRENIAHAFPDQDKNLLARQCFEHYGMCAIELLMVPFFGKRLAKYLKWEGFEVFDERNRSQEPTIMLSAHFGSWEVMAWAAARPLEFVGIYMEQTSPLMDRWIYELRACTGLQLTDKVGGMKSAYKVLQDGKILGNVGDQGRAFQIPFFGLETGFPAGPAKLALKTGAKLIFTVAIRKGKYIHCKVLGEIPLASGDTEEQILYNTASDFAQELEKLVLQYPEQYFWMHDVWKRFKGKKKSS